MILPKLYGRLGNQCFQIAAAIAHAKKMKTDWRVPYRSSNPNVWPTYFKSLPVARGAATMHAYQEKRHSYDPLPEHKDLTLDGYFQSEKYFDNAKEEIRTALGFDINNGGGYIAIHIRRGDYVTQFSDKHPPLSINYYDNAMLRFMDMGHHDFMIYSDDIEWCKKEFLFKDDKFCTISDPLAAMRHMYNADGFIIANSTFSLFPALLRENRIPVIAPSENRWYGPGNAHLETCDLLPERFIRL
jgi:hypothetical protein